MAKSRRSSPEFCPNCAEAVPPGSLACPSCGSDHESGWKEEAAYSSAGIPEDDDFNYDEYLEREFNRSPVPRGIKPIWWVTALILLALIILGLVLKF
jgi:hypothetical protein